MASPSRRVPSSGPTLESPTPTMPIASPGDAPLGLVHTDRVILDHLRAQAAAADNNAKRYYEQSLEDTKAKTATAEALAAANADIKSLRAEVERYKEQARLQQKQNVSVTRKSVDLEAEVSVLRKSRDHWQAGCQRALAEREAAVTTALSLRDAMRHKPGAASPAEGSTTPSTPSTEEAVNTALLLKAQLTQSRIRKEAYKSKAVEEHNRAESLQLRVEALEREVALLRRG